MEKSEPSRVKVMGVPGHQDFEGNLITAMLFFGETMIYIRTDDDQVKVIEGEYVYPVT